VIGPRFVLRMAWREARAGRRRLWLLTGAVTAGVAALVAINSFTVNLRTSVAEQAKAIGALGKEMYERLAVTAGHLKRVGGGLLGVEPALPLLVCEAAGPDVEEHVHA